jgi:threonine/homoserine/homoserine lactone efflux protein
MELQFLIKGVILGFSIAAPVGPIGVLCIRRTLQHGRLSGLFSGLGAAAADTIYGLIAAFGLTFVSDFLLAEQLWLRLIGGAFLFYLGGKTFFSKAAESPPEGMRHKTLLADFASTFFLTVSNPMTILSFLAVFAGLGLVNVSESYGDAVGLVGGIFVGSALWWLILSEGVTLFRKRVSQRVMRWINRAAGLIIVAFGLAAWLSLLHMA